MGKIAVTGAFGYSGKYITRKMLERRHEVITLTNSPGRADPFQGRVTPHAFNFDHPQALTDSLRGVDVLVNTYWVRFNHRSFTHEEAIRNSGILFEAAREAGVRRVVHVSITNPSPDSRLEYFSGKWRVEQALKATGLPYSILRPAVLFGREDILVNNIAWVLRRLPVFGVFGDGEYRIQPIYVDDLARLAMQEADRTGDRVIDAIGPETFTFRELVESIGEIIGRRRPVVGVPAWLGHAVGVGVGVAMRDVFLTRAEVKALMSNLLHVESEPVGETPLTAWAEAHSESLGSSYSSELARRRDRQAAYTSYTSD